MCPEAEARTKAEHWEPLEAFLRRREFYGPMRAGDPIGQYRLEAFFARAREQRTITVRGRPGKYAGEPQLLPDGEFHGYVIERPAHGATLARLFHAASGVRWYGVEVLEVQETEPAPGEEQPLHKRPSDKVVREKVMALGDLAPDTVLWPKISTEFPGATRAQVRAASVKIFGQKPANRPRQNPSD
jgi:hypothetical protein